MARDSYAVRTALLRGVEAIPVIVEVSMSQGIPGVTIVGMADTMVLESRHRVRCSMRQCGFEWPRAHYTVNLSPSEIRKTGTSFDLPIAVALLCCTNQIPIRDVDECMFVGELTLSGGLVNVRGMVAYERLANEQGLTLVAPGGTIATGGGDVRTIDVLTQLVQGVQSLPSAPSLTRAKTAVLGAEVRLDFADVVDQEVAKRAFVIAAAGEHGLLMVGPPGAGKSMMAKRMPTILAPMDEKEQAEALIIHSVAGQDLAPLLGGARPFRAPHHAVSFGGMVGGGRPVRPGEISLAHKGVLFLDELPEFGPSVLQALRQPMEEREVRIVRVDGTYIFPCDFMLVAAANPCPCGYLGDPDHHCTCSASRIQTYQSRIGGPLMDRIDVLVDVARPDSSRIISGEEGLSSEQMAEQVAVARGFASWRRERSDDKPDRTRNVPELGLDAQARASLEGVANRLGLGGRNIVRIARVARTIADLAESEEVKRDHVMEACAYRTRATL